MKTGDKIRLRDMWGDLRDFEVEEYRYTLGIFASKAHREAGQFTALCQLYEWGCDSEKEYIPNFGEYVTNQVPRWMDITEIKYAGD